MRELKAKGVVDILSYKQAEVKARTLGATLKKMVVKEQVETVLNTLAKVKAELHGYTLGHVDSDALGDRLSQKLD